MNPQNPKPPLFNPNAGPIAALMTVILGIANILVRNSFPQLAWAGHVALALFVLSVVLLAFLYRNSVSRRSLAYGAQSLTTVVLVLGILTVVNFLSVKYPQKLDLTRTKANTLSDQTAKVFKEMKEPVRLVYWAKIEEREKLRPLLDGLRALSSKLTIEYADTAKEMSRAKQAGIRAEGTLQVYVGERETKIENPDEEKVTNALIRLSRNSTPMICAIDGHAERDFASNSAEGYELARQSLEQQNYKFKKINLVSEGKIAADCSLIAILGPTKAFFEPEVALIRDYLKNGGRALFALDLNLKGPVYDASPEMTKLLSEWGIESELAIIVDPVSQMMRLEATVPVIPTFSKEVSITKELSLLKEIGKEQGRPPNGVFPLTRAFRIASPAPEGGKIHWLTQTTPNAWGEKDFQGIIKGGATFNPGTDIRGPLYTAAAYQGAKTRIVALGTSLLGTNQWIRFGVNLDFFANSVSWLLDDESMISIRAKEEPGGSIQLSAIQGKNIQLFTVVIVPLFMIIFGIVVWIRRRKL